MKVDYVRVIRDRPPPERSEIIPSLLIATFLVNHFPNLIAVQQFAVDEAGQSNDHAVFDRQGAITLFGEGFVVGHDNQRRTGLFGEAEQQIHD